jgi:glycosyltransferase involved in cell wall biosynthesis
MRILFVTHRYPPHTGGVETHVQEVATRLVERDHDVTVFSADAGSGTSTQTSPDGVRVRRFHSFSIGDTFYAAPQIARAVRRANADVIHAHNYHALPLLFAVLGATNERLVVTPHYHGESASAFRNRLLSLYSPLGRWAVRRADHVIAVSEWEREQLRDDFDVSAKVIPNGVDVGRFVDAEPEERETPYLLCVGRLEEYKGIQHVIRSLPDLTEYELVVAGSGPYGEQLQRIAREAGVADRVTFLGYVDEDRLPGLYAGADVYVTLSEFEAYGITVAEALAAKTPCVVRGGGALDYWGVKEGCKSVETTEPETIASAVRMIRERAPTFQVKRWDHVTDEVLQTYSE